MGRLSAAAWVLNLDAEDELARGGAHTPTAVMAARVEALLPRLAALISPGDQVIWPGNRRVNGELTGRAWCPTRFALEQMQRAGVKVPRTPSLEVLRRVTHRRFAHQLGGAVPGAAFIANENELDALLAHKPAASVEGAWILKRPLSYAGRGRKKMTNGLEMDRAWIQASLRTGDGLQLEPWVERVLDCALHGFIEEDGRCTLGQPTVQELDAGGAWSSTRIASPETLLEDEAHELISAGSQSAVALHAAGYFGPFGIDAFRWRDPDGELHFHPRYKINARYSMGWAIGMGGFEVPAGAW